MPLYTYIPYLDPEDTIARKTYSGKLTDVDDEVQDDDLGQRNDGCQNTTPPTIIKMESYKRKVSDNLKILNLKVKDLLHDGLNGVDNICKQAKGFVEENKLSPEQLDKYMENCGRGDIFDSVEEKEYNSSATEQSRYAFYFLNPQRTTLPKPISNTTVCMDRQVQETGRSPSSVKNTKPDTKIPRTKRYKDYKSMHGRIKSKSFNVSAKLSDAGRSTDKMRTPRGRSRKRGYETGTQSSNQDERENMEAKPSKIPVNETAKKRLGQIERDYQKVVHNLDMVERMMACINRKVSRGNSEEKSIGNKVKSNVEANSFGTKKTFAAFENQGGSKTIEMRTYSCETEKERNNKENENGKNRRTNLNSPQRINTQSRHEKEKKKTENANDFKITQKNTEENAARINESISDIDAMIDNAVQELGNIGSSDFYMSQSSSAVSFETVPFSDASKFYNCSRNTTSSDSDVNDVMGEDEQKFEISRSFQELKDSYLKKLKENSNTWPNRTKKTKEVKQKTSCGRLRDEIWKETNFLTPGKYSESSTGLHVDIKNIKSDTDILRKNNFRSQDTGDKVETGAKSDNCKENRDSENYFPNFCVVKPFIPAEMKRRSGEKGKQDSDTTSESTDIESDSQSIKSTKEEAVSKIHEIEPASQNMQTQENFYEEKEREDENPNETHNRTNIDMKSFITDSELCDCNDDFQANRREERNDRKKQKKKMRERKTASPSSRKSHIRATQSDNDKDNDQPTIHEKCRRITTNPKIKSRSKSKSKKRRPKRKTADYQSDTASSPQRIREKKMETHFSVSSSFVTSSSSEEDGLQWDKEEEIETSNEIKPIDLMEPVSIQCKKMFADLVQREDMVCLQKLMDGHFNSSLIENVASRPTASRFVGIHSPIQDSDLRSITPEVHRKRAISDLHDRMEIQIRQTDSFDGFLNLMNRNRRRAIIKQAERQDHNLRCHMKSNFRRRYPFRVITASVPTTYENKTRERKDPERKFVNSLWFSPKDFKLRRNSRIFNRKRMEMYCQALNKGRLIPGCKCKETALKELKKASNYSIKVRSGTPLGHRPNTPRRWIQGRPASGGPHRPRLNHCDILDDLTIKDLAPFESEYPRHDDRTTPETLHGSLLFKLACGSYKGDTEGTLMELVAPRLSCTQMGCPVCKPKSKSEKKPVKKFKSPRKHSDDAPSTAPRSNDIRTLSPKAAAKLLVQNIGEIKSKKSTIRTQASEKNLTRQKETKNKRSVKNFRRISKKTLSEDSKSTIHQRIENNLVKKLFHDQYIPFINIAHKTIHTNSDVMSRTNGPTRKYDHLHNNLKIPDLYPKAAWRRSTTNKLFPYINDPNNRVFQNITALPVEVMYDFEPTKEAMNKLRQSEVPIESENIIRVSVSNNAASLSETDDFEASTIDHQRPSTGDDRIRKINGRKRHGTPRSCSRLGRHNIHNTANIGGSISLEVQKAPNEEPYHNYSSKTINDNRQAIRGHKISSRKFRKQRCDSLGKSTESENGSEVKYFISQHRPKKTGNPNPWKPASNSPGRPKTPPVPRAPPAHIRSKELKKILQNQSSMGKIEGGYVNPQKMRRTPAYRLCDKCSSRHDTSVYGVKDKTQTQILVNRDNKLKFDLEPTKVFYNVDYVDHKPQSSRAYTHYPLNPAHRVMVDHLHALKNRNVKLQSNIQRAINIIEEKMADALSTNDHAHKKKTIERMEKEINKVLKIIDEQSYKTKLESTQSSNENRKETNFPDCQANTCLEKSGTVIETSKHLANEENNLERGPIPPSINVTITRPPRKRSVSRVLKCQQRPYTVEEENQSVHSDESCQLFEVHDVTVKEKVDDTKVQQIEVAKPQDRVEDEETMKPQELYSSIIAEGQSSLCPVLRCPSPKESVTCQSISQNTQKALSKMSKEAFGKFADVIKTKTKLIINMTERFDLKDANILPTPKINPTLQIRPPQLIIPTIKETEQNSPHLMNSSSVVSIKKPSLQEVTNTSTDRLSTPTTQISEFRKICSRRSHTSFSESECSYTWRRVERTHPINIRGSSTSLKHNISKDLTPFMKALNKLRAGKLFDNCEQLFSIEETSSSFTKLMDFLEGLSNVKEGLNPKVLRDVQLLWNPEKRCSFHSSIKCSRGVRYATTTKAISEHSINPSSASSCSQIDSSSKIEEKLSQTDIRVPNYVEIPLMQLTEENIQEMEHLDEPRKEIKEIFKSDLNFNRVEYKSVVKPKCTQLVLSDVHILSIPQNCNLDTKKRKRSNSNSNQKTYAISLKIFYLTFYALVYFCMNAMNFAC